MSDTTLEEDKTETTEEPKEGQTEEVTEEAEKVEENSSEPEKDAAKDEEKSTEEEDLIELPTGEKVTLDELKRGHLRDKDYRQKTMALAEERKKVDELLSKLPNATKAEATDDKAKDGIKAKYDAKALADAKALLDELGYVSEEKLTQRTYEEKKNQIVNTFKAQHPEYFIEGVEAEARYKALEEELGLYNTSDLSALPKILDRAHRDVDGRFKKLDDSTKEVIRRTRMKDATVGSKASGGSTASSRTGNPDLSPEQLKIMEEYGLLD